MGDGFGDLDQVLDEEGEVIDDHEDESRDDEDTHRSSDSMDETATSGTEPTTDSTPGEQAEVEEDTSDERSSQFTAAADIQSELTPNPEVVEDLASREIPGVMTSGERYPYAIRRSNWNDERGGTLRLVMRPETKEMEETASAEVQDELFANTDLNITDLREAAYIVGLQNLDDVVDVLNEWGFAEQEDLHD